MLCRHRALHWACRHHRDDAASFGRIAIMIMTQLHLARPHHNVASLLGNDSRHHDAASSSGVAVTMQLSCRALHRARRHHDSTAMSHSHSTSNGWASRRPFLRSDGRATTMTRLQRARHRARNPSHRARSHRARRHRARSGPTFE